MNKSLLLTATIALMCYPSLTNAQALDRGTNPTAAIVAQPGTANAASSSANNPGWSTDSNISTINAQISFYPNPFQSTLNVSLGNATQNAGSKLLIYNSAGVLLMQTILTELVNSYPMNNFAPGVYFYRVIRLNGAVQSGKIVAKHQY